MKHKFPNIIQVGDRVKYKNGSADYSVKFINQCGLKCTLIRNNEHQDEYGYIELDKLIILDKNFKLCSHKEIKKRTLNKEYYEKTNPHKKVHMPTTAKPKVEKDLDYLVTEFEPLLSTKDNADINDRIRTRKIITGKTALAEYILKLDGYMGIKLLREVRVLGKAVKINIKKEVVIK